MISHHLEKRMNLPLMGNDFPLMENMITVYCLNSPC